MTKKEASIVNSAISLFAEKGYHATSTRLIAENAEVSEGLIFKHFKNKEGLLEKIILISQDKLKKLIEPIESLSHPKVVIKHILTIPLNVGEDEKKLFKLINSIRWQMNNFETNLFNIFRPKILDSFKALNYNDPSSETETLLMMLEGTMLYVLQNGSKNTLLVLDNILKKFDI